MCITYCLHDHRMLQQKMVTLHGISFLHLCWSTGSILNYAGPCPMSPMSPIRPHTRKEGRICGFLAGSRSPPIVAIGSFFTWQTQVQKKMPTPSHSFGEHTQPLILKHIVKACRVALLCCLTRCLTVP